MLTQFSDDQIKDLVKLLNDGKFTFYNKFNFKSDSHKQQFKSKATSLCKTPGTILFVKY